MIISFQSFEPSACMHSIFTVLHAMIHSHIPGHRQSCYPTLSWTVIARRCICIHMCSWKVNFAHMNMSPAFLHPPLTNSHVEIVPLQWPQIMPWNYLLQNPETNVHHFIYNRTEFSVLAPSMTNLQNTTGSKGKMPLNELRLWSCYIYDFMCFECSDPNILVPNFKIFNFKD